MSTRLRSIHKEKKSGDTFSMTIPSRSNDTNAEALFAQLRLEEESWASRAAEVQPKAAQAYARLLTIAETSDTGQASRVARFIASSFNGTAHPFDLFHLRSLDVPISDDILLSMDALRWGMADLYKLVPDGEKRVKSVIVSWGF